MTKMGCRRASNWDAKALKSRNILRIIGEPEYTVWLKGFSRF